MSNFYDWTELVIRGHRSSNYNLIPNKLTPQDDEKFPSTLRSIGYNDREDKFSWICIFNHQYK